MSKLFLLKMDKRKQKFKARKIHYIKGVPKNLEIERE
jgi:hypothetical protein